VKNIVFALMLGVSLISAVSFADSCCDKKPKGVVWFEIPTTDLAKAQAFYSKVFGWKFGQPSELVKDVRYVVVLSGDHNGNEIGELVEMKEVKATFGVGIYFNADDIAKTYSLATKELGATEVYGVMNIPQDNAGSIAMFRDLDGNRIGLFSEKPIAK
jgi:predicted enzyme related to lactoylglutathione lyase